MNTEKDPKLVEKEEVGNPPAEDILSAKLKEPLPQKKARPVIFYIVVMFAVALFLIILSFFMQQRNHEALMQGISTSALNVQSIVDLEMEKNDLEDSLATTKTDLETAKAKEESLQAEVNASKDSLRALEYLGEARISHLSGKDKEARKQLALLKEGDLYQRLPETSALEGQPSPRQHYDELVNALS